MAAVPLTIPRQRESPEKISYSSQMRNIELLVFRLDDDLGCDPVLELFNFEDKFFVALCHGGTSSISERVPPQVSLFAMARRLRVGKRAIQRLSGT